MEFSHLGRKEFMIDEVVDISLIVKSHTTQNQFDALSSLATSIGIDAFSKSALLKKHNAGCFQCAQGQFMAWCLNGGDRQRRKREREVYYYGYK